ncbi:casein kinase I [Conglomerata obtusa]
MQEDTTIGNYKIIKEIGKGSFGVVYEAVNTLTNETYALKLEENNLEKSQLENEFKFYEILRGTKGIPEIYYYGQHDSTYYITMMKLDQSLADIHEERKNFTLKSICMIAKRMIRILEAIHANEYIYRDMKPENILTYQDEIYLIDFGMCKKYIYNGKHIPMIDNKVLTGTARYASINTHLGLEQSRRDDLEGLGYVLIFLLKGNLPWMGIPAPTRKEKYKKIGNLKHNTSSGELCKNLPGCDTFILYLDYVKGLDFTEEPNYSKMLKMFDNCMEKNQIKDDNNFDWIVRPLKNNNGDISVWKNLKTFFKEL